jgi:toxin ParE1/3/4
VLVKGFPFSIVYRATDTELLVVAVSPHRKRPGYWQPRLGDG